MERVPSSHPLPPSFRRAPFAVRDALALDIPRDRLRRRDLEAPAHGVRVRAGACPSRIEVFAVVLRPDQHFSHTSAAAVWGGPLPASAREEPVHVTSTSDVAMRRAGVVGHRVRSATVRRHQGVRVSTPARAWFECASLLAVEHLVALGDHLVGLSGLATLDDLAAEIRPGSRASRTAREALDRVRVGAESAMETWLRLAVVDAGFPEPELQVKVFDRAGRFIGRVDLAWPELRIALEYDGDQHRERDAFQRDQRRRNDFEVNDWLAIHVTAADAARPAVLFERLRQAFARRTGELSSREWAGHAAVRSASGEIRT